MNPKKIIYEGKEIEVLDNVEFTPIPDEMLDKFNSIGCSSFTFQGTVPEQLKWTSICNPNGTYYQAGDINCTLCNDKNLCVRKKIAKNFNDWKEDLNNVSKD